MTKVVYQNSDGDQFLIKLKPSGRCLADMIIWNEKIHGPLSSQFEAALGGLVRQGTSVTIDTAMLGIAQAKLAQKAQARSDLDDAIGRVKSLDLTKTVVQSAIKDMVRVLRG